MVDIKRNGNTVEITEDTKGITRNSLQIYANYKSRLGSVLTIDISRHSNGWDTRIIGTDATMYLNGLSFGYSGEGTRGLLQLIDWCNLDCTPEEKSIILGQSTEKPDLMIFCRNAETKTVMVIRDGFKRTALQLKESGTTSVDVLAPNGDVVCTLNIASKDKDANWANVDVCYGISNRTGRVLAWNDGRETLDFTAAGSSLIAVEIVK